MLLHSLFDLLAVLSGIAVYAWLPVPDDGVSPREPLKLDPYYPLALALGAAIGAYGFGTLNAWLSDQPGIGRSIAGALAGAIVAIEMLKSRRGIRISTGLRFVAPLATAIAVGRIGCFLSGLEDFTHGTPTLLAWGWDFGDGVPRHPVQLYESAAMLAFLATFVVSLQRRLRVVLRIGFYLFVAFYAGQRIAWEFLKPYGTVIGPFNLFHLLSLFLIAYAIVFSRRELSRA